MAQGHDVHRRRVVAGVHRARRPVPRSQTPASRPGTGPGSPSCGSSCTRPRLTSRTHRATGRGPRRRARWTSSCAHTARDGSGHDPAQGRPGHAAVPTGRRRAGGVRRLGRRDAAGVRPVRRHRDHHRDRSPRSAGDATAGIPVHPARHLADPVEHPGQPAVVVAGTPPARPASTSTSSTRTHRSPGWPTSRRSRSPVPVVLTYHSGSLVKGGHPVDALLRAYERHVLPRVFDRCCRPGRGLAGVDGARDRPRRAGPAGRRHRRCSPRRPAAASASRACSTSAGSSAPRAGRACRCWSTRWRGCANSCPTSGSTSSATATTCPRLRARAERARRRRPRSTGTARSTHADAAGVLPARRGDRAAVADRVRVVRHDAGRGDGLRLPGRRLGRRRDPVRGPRRRRRTARAARRRRPRWPTALAAVLTDPARAAALGAAGREAAQSRWDWARQEEHTVRVHRGGRATRPEEGEGVMAD